MCLLLVGCGGEPPPPPTEALEPLAKAAEAAGVKLPVDPAQLEQLTRSLGELTALVDRAQSARLQYETASSQGRARMVQNELSRFLDGLDPSGALPQQHRANRRDPRPPGPP